MLAFKDAKLAELKKEIKLAKSRALNISSLHKTTSSIENAPKVEYRIIISPDKYLHKTGKTGQVLNKLSNTSLLHLLTAQSKIIEQKLADTNKKVAYDGGVSEEIQKASLGFDIMKILGEEEGAHSKYKADCLCSLEDNMRDSKSSKIDVAIENLISEGDILEVGDLIVENDYAISDETSKRLIKELVLICKSSNKPAVLDKNVQTEEYLPLFKEEASDKEKIQQIIMLHKELQKTTEKLNEVNEVIEDISSEHSIAVAKLEHILGIGNIQSTQKSANNSYSNVLETTRAISNLIREVWSVHGKAEMDHSALLKFLQETCIPANEIYKEFFIEESCGPITVELLLDRIKAKNNKFKGLFRLYEQLLDVNSTLLFSKEITSPLSKGINAVSYTHLTLPTICSV
eukprot:TRINITY_DN1927_c0_g2_i1.p1 TRINITY_DN1927_c0_g2~~TRINITY_DN1927_c0_g2_i1.p1  ORF type:complete len:443 (+),score=49.69 TRINITY_DN1927_c0_g2_i1:124-1329(+)